MSVVDSVLLVVAACLLLIRFCSLFRYVCCSDMSVVDSVLLAVVASHVAAQSRRGRAQSHTSGPSNGRPFGLKKSTAVPQNAIGTIYHSDRQPVCNIEQFQFDSSAHFAPVQGRRHNGIGLMHDYDLPRVHNVQQLQLYSSQRLARSQGKWHGGFVMMYHSDRQQV
jgi:hypothetical protein